MPCSAKSSTVQASRRQERIAEIVAAVPKRRSRLLHHPGWLSAAAAAVLLALVTLWAVAAEPESLLAFVQKAKAESARAGDRRYELRVQPALGRERVRELYTRGESAFVLRGSFLWGQFVLGRNARQAWLVPPLRGSGAGARFTRFVGSHPRRAGPRPGHPGRA
jgi:hypothetical protein